MIGDIPSVLRDVQAAKSGQPDAMARLAKSAVRLIAPEYAPVIDGVSRLANHLGVKLTPEGIDLTELRDLLVGSTGEQGENAAHEPWDRFLSRLRRLSSGVVLVLGPRGSGKTCLAVRLAEQWRREHGYDALGINMYPQDRKPWIRFASMAVFARTIDVLTEHLDEGMEPPAEICRKIVLIDEAALSLHPQGQRGGILAVERAIRQARHLEWLLIVVAHLTKDLPTQMDWCDAVFIKEPTGKELTADREESQRYWQAADKAYRDLRRSGLRGKPIQGWVYVEAAGLGYSGMMPYGLAGNEDPYQAGQVHTVDGPPYPDREVIDQ